STSIQNEMKLEIENKEIIQMLGLEKSLVYFTTSLKSNRLLLQKMSKTRLIKFDEEDIDFVEGVEIDNRQAIEMADTYSDILFGVMNAYSSIISNNLNVVMKKLAIINLVMMVPTFITSFFGMNYPLPFESFGRFAVVIVSGICFVSIFLANWMLNIDKNNLNIRRLKIRTNKKQRKIVRKQTREIKKQEKMLQKIK
ncbi:MAG: magnesium transporter CorA family protein, partial [Treponema bryantii]|nr:magnesium transporter CorA family protein [Treponema bryantii]